MNDFWAKKWLILIFEPSHRNKWFLSQYMINIDFGAKIMTIKPNFGKIMSFEPNYGKYWFLCQILKNKDFWAEWFFWNSMIKYFRKHGNLSVSSRTICKFVSEWVEYILVLVFDWLTLVARVSQLVKVF